jgi:RNA polymerase sigma-70 factor (ECF subfamily)
MESEELVSLIKEAIASLPEKENLVFIMKEYQGMKFSEIADILNYPLGTLMSLNYRAIERLKKTLSKYVGD